MWEKRITRYLIERCWHIEPLCHRPVETSDDQTNVGDRCGRTDQCGDHGDHPHG